MKQLSKKILFMGSSQFSSDVLENLIANDNCNVVAAYTMPDAIRSRGRKMTSTPVAELASKKCIDVYTPKNFKDQNNIEILKSFKPDFIVVAAYGVLLPKQIIDAPKYECLNIHGSLLPKWRGAAPVQRAILNGDKTIGYSIMKMDEGLDTGDYCFQNSILTNNKSVNDVFKWMAKEGSISLLNCMDKCLIGNVEWISQNENMATYAEKLNKRELWINNEDSLDVVIKKVKASSDECPAKCSIFQKNVRIIDADIKENKLNILRIKPDGKSEMSWEAFVSGIKNLDTTKLIWSSIEQ